VGSSPTGAAKIQKDHPMKREDLDILSVDQLKDELMRQYAMLSDQFDNLSLVEMHVVDGTLTMDLANGPVAYLAEYMAQVLGHPNEPNNYMELVITHRTLGPLVLTLQRQNGKTPHQLMTEARAEADRVKRHLNQLYGDTA
jgi:hypothetical protein